MLLFLKLKKSVFFSSSQVSYHPLGAQYAYFAAPVTGQHPAPSAAR
jgi:hypothetical protein